MTHIKEIILLAGKQSGTKMRSDSDYYVEKYFHRAYLEERCKENGIPVPDWKEWQYLHKTVRSVVREVAI